MAAKEEPSRFLRKPSSMALILKEVFTGFRKRVTKVF